MGPLLRAWRSRAELADSASVGVFRIAFGLGVLWMLLDYLQSGFVQREYVDAKVMLPLRIFGFLDRFPGPVMSGLWHLLALLALMIALGLRHRLAAALFALIWGYFHFVNLGAYTNHNYLIWLLSILFALTGAGSAYAIDSLLGWDATRFFRLRAPDGAPSIGPEQTERWRIALFQFQIFVVYFGGGIAKLNRYWLAGEPVRTWAKQGAFAKGLIELPPTEWGVNFITYGGLVFDLTVGFALLSRWGRWVALGPILFFHLSNSRTFDIGVFPPLMIATTIVFFPGEGVRALVANLGRRLVGVPAIEVERTKETKKKRQRKSRPVERLSVDEAYGKPASRRRAGKKAPRALAPELAVEPKTPEGSSRPEVPTSDPTIDGAGQRDDRPRTWWRTVRAGAVGTYVGAQLLLPIRPHVLSADADWTGEGHLYSWRMMLREKHGNCMLFLDDKALGKRWNEELVTRLTVVQARMVSRQPDVLWDYVRSIERVEGRDLEIRADCRTTYNGHPLRRLVKPEVDLTSAPNPLFGHAPWIEPEPGGPPPR